VVWRGPMLNGMIRPVSLSGGVGGAAMCSSSTCRRAPVMPSSPWPRGVPMAGVSDVTTPQKVSLQGCPRRPGRCFLQMGVSVLGCDREHERGSFPPDRPEGPLLDFLAPAVERCWPLRPTWPLLGQLAPGEWAW